MTGAPNPRAGLGGRDARRVASTIDRVPNSGSVIPRLGRAQARSVAQTLTSVAIELNQTGFASEPVQPTVQVPFTQVPKQSALVRHLGSQTRYDMLSQ